MTRTVLGPTQTPIQWVAGALSMGVKQPGHEADHSPPSSAKIMNTWSYTSNPQYIFMAWCLVKHRNNFTLSILSGELQWNAYHYYSQTKKKTGIFLQGPTRRNI